ncbi:MAG: hypothetical protein H0U74_07420 [Bradymonadaceae bacterium]|nr:hypothetical protein [Lujinxingiaceae bacterium]
MVEVPQQAAPKAVRALWNPAESTLPSPTDLVRDTSQGRLNLPIDTAMTAAEQEFRRYLNGLDGYPLSIGLTIPLSGPVSAQSLPGTLIATDLSTGAPVLLDPSFDANAIAIKASASGAANASFLPGRTYGFGLWGYEGGARGLYGEPVIADAAFYFVRAPYALGDHATAMPGETRAERQATADRLEDVQVLYAPLFAAMRERGIVREQVAVVSHFTTTARPAVWFDPASKRIPMPNDLLVDAETGLVTLPSSPGDDEERRQIAEGLSHYDGFSTSGPLVVKSTHRLHPDAARDAEVFRVFRHAEDGSWVEEIDVVRGLLDDGHSIWLKPRLAFEPSSQYAYVVTGSLRSESGVYHEAQPLTALLRLQASLVDANGHSELSSLSDAEAVRLEPHRDATASLLDKLAASGVGRSQLAAAVPFRTTSAASILVDRRAELYKRNVRTDVVNITTTEPSGALRLLLNNVKTIVRGELTVLDHLDERTHAIEPGSQPKERLVKFSLTLPKNVDPTRPVPVVLFGHGLMTSRELLYLIADELAQGGFAALSLDLPMHGDRAICKTNSDCQSAATCDDLGQCINADGSKGSLARFELPYLLPFLGGTQYEELLSYPITSGAYFIEFENLFATRDHFGQAVLDLCQALRVIRGPELSAVAKTHAGLALDGNDVVYLGMSLGGILGASLSAVEPTLESFVLNVPGADMVRLIEYSDLFKHRLAAMLASKNIAPGSDDYFAFANAVRWILDPIDPLNLVQHTVLDPLSYVDPIDNTTKRAPAKRVLIQMAEGDLVVPNEGTRVLSERMGVPFRTYTPSVTNHGFLFDPNPLSQSTRAARDDMMEFFDAR